MITLLGFMLSMIVVLSVLESALPPIPFLPPHFKLGLANIVTMYCVLRVGKARAIALNVLKSIFVFLTRGAMAGLLSFCGGLLSILTLVLLLYIGKNNISYLALSVAGATAHNIGQFIALAFILDMGFFIYYLPFSLIAGSLMGAVTGTLLRTVLPALEKHFPEKHDEKHLEKHVDKRNGL
jgi:heptaprenyl diphosphate synthase